MKTVYSSKSGYRLTDAVKQKCTRDQNEANAVRHRQDGMPRMAIFAHDFIGLQINQDGMYEGEELDTLFSFFDPLKPSFSQTTCLDIGANIGNHSRYFSKYFKNVVAFEPNPSTFQLLEFNCEPMGNVVCNHYGLGAASGVLPMVEKVGNAGGAFISNTETSETATVSVKVRKLDDLGLNPSEVTFIKMDVEGFEANVLTGGQTFIRNAQPIIVFEQHPGDFVNGTTPCIEALSVFGYKFCWYERGETSKYWLKRRYYNFKKLFFGVEKRIVFNDIVPEAFHPMLIAIPDRFISQLMSS